MASITIHAAVRRIHDFKNGVDVYPQYLLYCVPTLNVASNDADSSMLRPWHWLNVAVQAWVIKNGTLRSCGVHAVPYQAELPEGVLDDLKVRLKVVATTVESFVVSGEGNDSVQLPDSDVPPQNSDTSTAQKGVEKVNGRHWIEVLAQAARLPAPLGAALNLVSVVRLDRAGDPDGFIVAAPKFIVGGATWSPDVPVLDANEWTVTIRYNNGVPDPEHSLSAVLRIPSDAPAQSIPKLWFDGNELSTSGRMWFGRLHRDVAACLDLAERWLKALRGTMQLNPVWSNSDTGWVRRAFLTLLRWQTHGGFLEIDKDGVPRREEFRWSGDLLLEIASLESTIDNDPLRMRPRLIVEVGQKHDLPMIPESWDDDKLKKWYSIVAATLGARSPDWLIGSVGATLGPEGVISELEGILGALQDEATFATLITTLWRHAEALVGDGETRKFTEAARSVNLRESLVVDRLQSLWAKFVKRHDGDSGITSIRQNLKSELWVVIAGMFPANDLPDLISKARDKLLCDICSALSKVGPEGVDHTEDPALPSAHPMVLTVGSLLDADADRLSAGSASDLSGIGVLMRRTYPLPKHQGWHCLNMARVSVDTTEPTEQNSHSALNPRSVSTQNGLETVVMSYDGHPFAGRTLASKLTLTGDGLEENQFDRHGLRIHYEQLLPEGEDGSPEWYLSRLPGLYFGAQYHLAAFRVLIGGGLPAELTEAGNPLKFKPPNNGDVQGAYLHPYCHLRRTRVGAPRLTGKDGIGGLNLPPIPRDLGVVPLLDDLLSVERPGGTRGASALAGLERDSAILLLPQVDSALDQWMRPSQDDNRTKQDVWIRPPTVDERIFDQWVGLPTDLNGGQVATLIERAQVLAAWSDWRSGLTQSREPVAIPEELTLDDPAIQDGYRSAGRCGVRLYQLAFTNTGMPSLIKQGELFIEFNRSEEGGGKFQVPPRFRAKPIKLEIVSSEQFVLTESNSVYRCEVPQGHVGIVKFVSLVDAQLVSPEPQSRRFELSPDQFSGESKEAWVDPQGKEWLSAGRTRLAVEVATAVLPSVNDVWERARIVEFGQTEWALGFDPALSVSDKSVIGATAVDYCKRVELDIQRWRWSGRQLPEIPEEFSKIVEAAPESFVLQPKLISDSCDISPGITDGWVDLAKWDGAAFGDRRDEDALTRSAVIPAPSRVQGSEGREESDSGLSGLRSARVHKIDITGDMKAAYLRFRVKVTSRYAGLMNNDGARESGVGVVRAGWRRLFIKNRVTDILPRPKIRFFLPMTQGAGAQPNTEWSQEAASAPILLLLDESFYRSCGLAERIEMEVAKVKYVGKDGRVIELREMGPDPRVSDSAPAQEHNVCLEDQPFALTFEPTSPAPWPASTCFLIQGTTGTPAGTFAKVRFRRRALEALSIPQAAGVGDPGADAWTDAVWIQFLGDARSWLVEDGSGFRSAWNEELLFVPTTTGLRVKARGENGYGDVFLRCEARSEVNSRPLRRQLLLVLTRTVPEAYGNRTSEVPIGLGAEQTFAGTQFTQFSLNTDWLTPGVSVRVLEIESRLDPTNPMLVETSKPLGTQPLWDRLFEKEVADSARLRIVRISPPIDVDPSM